ncbi:PAN2-PAN3 deadenylation complex subunit pan3-like [Branchiostoma floridae]|uniref:PAN2-PAN3 deadenylation complex subunit PAN3 n=1 Tax=Branchiostoma floridae TaxID=7739 RepID=A0A9J7LEB2_BRAFL|nr:PAN2-PAN3 deadenylation complex subunit pan3-like [Branchiostoma floridae]
MYRSDSGGGGDVPHTMDNHMNSNSSPNVNGAVQNARPFFPAEGQAPPQEAPAVLNNFSSLSISSNKGGKIKGVDAHEFIPGNRMSAASSVPSMTGLGVSMSSPSLSTMLFTAQPHTPAAAGAAVPSGASLSAGASPLGSPLSSPGANRRKPPYSGSYDFIPGQTSTPGGTMQQQAMGPASSAPAMHDFGGTTYFYTAGSQHARHSPLPAALLPGGHLFHLPHTALMKPKANQPSFFMQDELRLDTLRRQYLLAAQIDPVQHPDIPSEVDNYHTLYPLEPVPRDPKHRSSTFGFITSCYKGISAKDAMAYCLTRIHGFHMVNSKCMLFTDMWKKIQHSNIVQLREVFTTKAFGEHSLVFVHDYHPGAETLMAHHFNNPQQNKDFFEGTAASKGMVNGPRQHAGLLPESLIWCYVVQLSSALRTIHAAGLACRVMDPTKILITGKSRLRVNCVGIFDVLTFDVNQSNPMALIPQFQQEDLLSLGKVVLALACNSVAGIQREFLQKAMELVTLNYSSDLKNLILYLLTNQGRPKSVNDIMPMIGARFYTQLDAAHMRCDVIESELAKEVENGRLFRLLCKLGIINDRPGLGLDSDWSETGDRYLLKLFRDYLFHQVTESGEPWIDMAHVVQCLNKLDTGVPEKLCLVSRDEQSVLVLNYHDLKRCFEQAFQEVLTASQPGEQPPTSLHQ